MSMVQLRTVLNVADNSGARKVYCINSYGKAAGIGQVVLVVVKDAIPHSKVKKSEKYMAVIVRTKGEVKRADFSTISFDDTAVVLLDKKLEPVGTRVLGAVAREIRSEGFLKIVSLAEKVV